MVKYSVLQSFAPFGQHFQRNTQAQAIFKCLFVAVGLLVRHQFARGGVTTSIDSLGARGA